MKKQFSIWETPAAWMLPWFAIVMLAAALWSSAAWPAPIRLVDDDPLTVCRTVRAEVWPMKDHKPDLSGDGPKSADDQRVCVTAYDNNTVSFTMTGTKEYKSERLPFLGATKTGMAFGLKGINGGPVDEIVLMGEDQNGDAYVVVVIGVDTPKNPYLIRATLSVAEERTSTHPKAREYKL